MLVELVEIFANNIFPILLLAAIGFAVGRHFGIEPDPVSTLIFYVFTPALVFYKLYTSDIGGGEFVSLYLLTILFHFIMILVTYLALRLQNAGSPIERANVIIAAFCLNAGNYGLSLVSFAFGDAVLSRAVVVYIANITSNYTLGVYIASNGRKSATGAFASVFKTPALYALIAAFLLRGFSLNLPIYLDRSIEMLSDATIPLMLMLLGLQLGQFARMSKFNLLATGVSLKLLLAPLVGIGLAALFGLEGITRTAFILQTGMPTAVITIIIATEFDLDRDLALNLIMISTLLSPLTLSVLIMLLR